VPGPPPLHAMANGMGNEEGEQGWTRQGLTSSPTR
jgi:hypothetical protein